MKFFTKKKECNVVAIDPVKELKMNSIDFFSLVERRNLLLAAKKGSACDECEVNDFFFFFFLILILLFSVASLISN